MASGWFDGAVHLAANMSLLMVLAYGGTLVADAALTAGELTSFLVYSLYVGINFSQVWSCASARAVDVNGVYVCL